jgi:Rps23 Pro-64 3,4-dihydroxylase Tpa1-like proline 4-hydroxylase
MTVNDSTGTCEVAINPVLDLDFYAAAFGKQRRVLIPQFFEATYANGLYQSLVHAQDWSYYVSAHHCPRQATPDVRARYTLEQEGRLAGLAYDGAREGFAFLYEGLDAGEVALPNSPVRVLAEFLNSRRFLSLLLTLTGVDNGEYVDVHPTRYRAGHFLLPHTDSKIIDRGGYRIERKIAYVVNLTADWKPEWGGLLQFLSEDGRLTDTYIPCFNGLTLFSVPQAHTVSLVAPFATGTRYTLSGWVWTPVSGHADSLT